MPFRFFSGLLLFFLSAPSALFAQDEENLRNESLTLDEHIRAAQLYLPGAPLALPIVELKTGSNTLLLGFDHLGDDLKDYIYTIVHCNSDWQPSDLIDNEYIDGFTEDRITSIDISFNTLYQYTHYSLALPNRNMRWTKSGNYLLKIYDNDDDRRLVLVRRFCVVEPLWRVEAKLVNPVAVSKLKTHHEIDFNVLHRGTRIPNPQGDVKAFVLQNGRWDNAIGPMKPYITREEQLVYDYQDKIVFPAGKEWRYFDMRTFDYRGERVKAINDRMDYYEVTLDTDKDRAGSSLVVRGDLNGRFSIENTNYNQTLLQCDYAKVLFSISQNQPKDKEDVYVFGEMTDWKLKPEYKMDFSPEAKAYYCESPLLKQGYYNYEYVVVNRETGQIDEDGFEGNLYETSNLYTILVYFRTFGERYDRLMSAVTIDSKDRQ
ncbi:MAG: DUF5103 domain-containing protein [Saprospiraceae bacterium]|nr:DUF5103 domain-containing protein [Saprospiraceae bacterium]